MPQSQIVDPKEVRSAGKVSFGEIPINAYSATAKDEVKRYGAEKLQRVLYDMLTIREFESMLNDIKMQGSYRGIEYNHKGPAHLSIGQESTAVGTCLELDVDEAKVDPYEQMQALMTAPGVYLLDSEGKLVKMLQGELTAEQLRRALGAGQS